MRKMINNKKSLSSAILCWVLAAKQSRSLPRFHFSLLPKFSLPPTAEFSSNTFLWYFCNLRQAEGLRALQFNACLCLMSDSHSPDYPHQRSFCSAARMSTYNLLSFQCFQNQIQSPGLKLVDFLSFLAPVIKFPFRTLSPNPFLNPYTYFLSSRASSSELTVFTCAIYCILRDQVFSQPQFIWFCDCLLITP